jgi:hypothetical protein
VGPTLPSASREGGYYGRLHSLRLLSLDGGVSRDALESIADISSNFAGICLAVVGVLYSLRSTGVELPAMVGIFLIAAVVFFGATAYTTVLALAAGESGRQYAWLSRLAFHLFTFSILWMLFFVVLLQFGLMAV